MRLERPSKHPRFGHPANLTRPPSRTTIAQPAPLDDAAASLAGALLAFWDARCGCFVKAAVCEAYGPPEVVRIMEVPKPVPAAGEVLIRAAATTVNSGDARVRALRVPRGVGLAVRLKFGLTKPKQPMFGFDVAGRIEAVGTGVTRFHPGDRVVASRDLDLGCHAEYVTVAEQGAIATIPDTVSDTDAVALCFGGSTALHFFERAKLAAGQQVLINGASGAVGAMAVQLAKHTGAEVTAVCSGANADLVTSLGADHVVDYTAEDFTAQRTALRRDHGQPGQRHLRPGQGLAGTRRPGPDGLRGALADDRRVVAEGGGQRRPPRVSAEPPPNPRRPDRAEEHCSR